MAFNNNDPTFGGLVDGHARGGYWGRDIRSRIAADFTPDKVLTLNFQKIEAMGLPFALWRDSSTYLKNLPLCSCFKDTAKQPDDPCRTCNGTGYIPGFLKFGTQNYWSSSIDGWTFNNLLLDTNNRPYRIMMSPGVLTGTAISPLVPVASLSNKIGLWDYRIEAFTRDAGANSSVTVQVSTNAGLTWYTLDNLEGLLPTPSGPSLPLMLGMGNPLLNMPSLPLCLQQPPTLGVMFKVTMTRGLTTTKSPMFEIVRIRYPTITDIATVNPLNEPVIRCIPTWLTEANLKQIWGEKFESEGRRFWTVPLQFFDNTIPNTQGNGQLTRISEDSFAEVRYGGEIGYRYRLTQFSYSDTFGEFTRQEMSLRKLAGYPGSLSGESEYLCF